MKTKTTLGPAFTEKDEMPLHHVTGIIRDITSEFQKQLTDAYLPENDKRKSTDKPLIPMETLRKIRDAKEAVWEAEHKLRNLIRGALLDIVEKVALDHNQV